MKKIITIAFILIGFSMNAQTPFFSAYNKGKSQPKNVVFGEWKNYNGSETFLYELSPTGYKKTLSELKNVLDFYGLDIDAEDYDDSLFYENESIYDIQKIYTNCILKYSNIVKIYRAKYVNITFIVTDEYSNFQNKELKNKELKNKELKNKIKIGCIFDTKEAISLYTNDLQTNEVTRRTNPYLLK